MTRFGLVELDLLATHAGAPIPYPLRVPSYGRVAGERDGLFAAASEALQVRGLADAAGPTGPAADVVAALARRRGTVDLVVRGPAGERGAVAMVYGKHAVLCRQDLDGDRLVDARRIPLSAVAAALTALVPDLTAAPAMPIRLPAAAATTTANHHHVIAEHGGDPDDLEALTDLITAVDGSGQLGATTTTRDGGTVRDTRATGELAWLDTPSGRVRVTTGPDGWISVNPLSPGTLRAAAEDLVEALRR